MKEIFVNEVINNLSCDFTSSQLRKIKESLCIVCDEYKVERQQKSLIVYEQYPYVVKEFIASRIVEGMSENTIKLYELRLRQFFSMVKLPVEEVDTNNIRVFLNKYKEKNRISNRTLDTFRTIISVFFGWAAAEGYIDKNPCVPIKPIKYTKKKRKALTIKEVELIRNACKDLRERTILEFLLSTGCRVNELCNAKICDLKLQEGILTVLGKGNKEREVYLSPKSQILLDEYLAQSKPNRIYLFESRLCDKYSKNGIESIIREIGKRAGFKLYPHLLRHTKATIMLQSGAQIIEVQKLLGHESVDTTLEYTNVLQEDVRRASLRTAM